ncbi:mycofactocin system transcriptional regulator [Conexibacter sp. CPCC 206217]|uniref:mycofactocin system transcriptional regulator n=1 Tax=Conexibacter sp. CPCC 206217 TaxID=3064574 RepID=UPI0027250E84|nr:mycofactocin system transcriptional regulator [Conexibacter sp. CPCC 206217]MDO8212432.1 mycofactocin system transcriptional regulator [Conexibacter sp. CPCC 206217]
MRANGTPVARGRPKRTTPAEVSRAALELFAANGFVETTVDDIASALGVGRRTLFRYFSSKNDTVWGDFDWVLDRLRGELAKSSPDEPLMGALGRAIVASNSYPSEELPQLRLRMTLITAVPALQAHSMLRYQAWREVVAEYAAQRLGLTPEHHVPQTIAHTAFGTSMAAFVTWVGDPDADLEASLREGYRLLATGFDVTGS